jgi:endonuclease/exonuclease/phosphatase (EEP) superfamily protein YafD
MRLILNLASLFVRGTALMLALIGAGAGLAGLGGAFSDRLDALTHGAPVWLACSLFGLALALAFSRDDERRAIAGMAMAGVIAIAGVMAPELLSALHRPEQPAHDAQVLKVIQFNAWADNHDAKGTAAWLTAQNADIVVMEESGARAFPVVRALRAAYPYASPCSEKHGCDTRIFSRSPIVQNGVFQDGRDGLTGAWTTLHDPRGDFTVVGVHFVWPIPAGPWQRQSRRLVTAVARFSKDDMVLAGDFNSTPWSWGLRRQDKALGLQRRTRALASWPSGAFSRVVSAPFPILPIDQVYAGKAWKTVKVERGPVLGSDHRPVVVTLAR